MAATPPSTRTIAKVFLTVVWLAALLYVLYLVRRVVGLVAIAIFLAIALGPAVDFFSRRLVPRSLSILVVYFLIFLAIVGVGLLVVPPVVTQVESFGRDVPRYLNAARGNATIRKYDDRYKITEKLKVQARKLPARLGQAAGALRDVTVGVFSALVTLITVLTIVFFLLLDGRRIAGAALKLAGPAHEPGARAIAEDIYRAVAGYVAGNLAISVIAGLVTYVTLLLLGVPFAAPLAVLLAFLDLIPLVGATIGAIAIGIVTLFNDFPTSTLVWIVVAFLYQQVENNVIQPMVYRRTVSVQPLVVIIAILIGATLLGLLGALVAIPVAASLQIIARKRPGREEPEGAVLLGGEAGASPERSIVD